MIDKFMCVFMPHSVETENIITGPIYQTEENISGETSHCFLRRSLKALFSIAW